ncbi:MAG TPA: zinc transporter ZntB [Kofleriaceae bacterium]|nr:zinc transporter ZntB [Kofleriaceae bacterium]
MSTPGLHHALLLDGKGGARALDWTAVGTWTPADGVLWLNFDYTVSETMQWLATTSQLDAVTISALTDSDPRPRAVAHGDHFLMILRGINNNVGAAPEDMISVRSYIAPQRVLTFHHRSSTTIASILRELEHGTGPRTAGELALVLVERIVEHVVARVDLLGDAVAACEDRTLGEEEARPTRAAGQRADLRHTLADQRRRAIQLRRFLAPQRDAMHRLASLNVPLLEPQHRARVSEVSEDMLRAIEELDAARDRAAVTQEELSSRVADTANQRLYVLSIITAFFLPLGFVCALLGVNIGGVPLMHEDWAFWGLCGVFVVYVLVQLWFFRRRGWL